MILYVRIFVVDPVVRSFLLVFDFFFLFDFFKFWCVGFLRVYILLLDCIFIFCCINILILFYL